MNVNDYVKYLDLDISCESFPVCGSLHCVVVVLGSLQRLLRDLGRILRKEVTNSFDKDAKFFEVVEHY